MGVAPFFQTAKCVSQRFRSRKINSLTYSTSVLCRKKEEEAIFLALPPAIDSLQGIIMAAGDLYLRNDDDADARRRRRRRRRQQLQRGRWNGMVMLAAVGVAAVLATGNIRSARGE
jgi:hypothetical protein